MGEIVSVRQRTAAGSRHVTVFDGSVSGRKLRMLLCCAGAPFLSCFDTNIVAVLAASIARDLRGGFTDVEWVVSAYILPFAALLNASRRLGRPSWAAAHAAYRAVDLYIRLFLCGADTQSRYAERSARIAGGRRPRSS